MNKFTRILSSGHNGLVKLKIQREEKIFEIQLILQDRLKVLDEENK